MSCPACAAPEGTVIPPHDLDFCNDHLGRWMEMQREVQPPVRRSWAPRCLICAHAPRLLRRHPSRDAWECRWGHDVAGYDLYRQGVSV